MSVSASLTAQSAAALAGPLEPEAQMRPEPPQRGQHASFPVEV